MSVFSMPAHYLGRQLKRHVSRFVIHVSIQWLSQMWPPLSTSLLLICRPICLRVIEQIEVNS